MGGPGRNAAQGGSIPPAIGAGRYPDERHPALEDTPQVLRLNCNFVVMAIISTLG
jgi:hypothetical protein